MKIKLRKSNLCSANNYMLLRNHQACILAQYIQTILSRNELCTYYCNKSISETSGELHTQCRVTQYVNYDHFSIYMFSMLTYQYNVVQSAIHIGYPTVNGTLNITLHYIVFQTL